jgi:hypothetical protein
MSERFWGRICLKAHVFFGEYQSTLSTFVGSVSNPSLRWQLQTLPKKWGGSQRRTIYLTVEPLLTVSIVDFGAFFFATSRLLTHARLNRTGSKRTKLYKTCMTNTYKHSDTLRTAQEIVFFLMALLLLVPLLIDTDCEGL